MTVIVSQFGIDCETTFNEYKGTCVLIGSQVNFYRKKYIDGGKCIHMKTEHGNFSPTQLRFMSFKMEIEL